MKTILIIIVAALISFTWVLAKAAGMASREEEKRWSEDEQAHKEDG